MYMYIVDIVVSDSEEKRIISATWAKDEDISRLLRFVYFKYMLHSPTISNQSFKVIMFGTRNIPFCEWSAWLQEKKVVYQDR